MDVKMRGFTLLITCTIVVMSFEAHGKANRQGRVKHGVITRHGESPQKTSGKIEFAESVTVDIDIEGKARKTVQLKKKNIDPRRISALKIKGSSVYMSDDNSVTYREECTEERNCQGFAIIQGENSAEFVSKTGSVLEIPSHPGAKVAFENKPDLPKRSHVNRVPEPKNDASRIRRNANMTKRALGDEFDGSRVAKMLYFVDDAFMNEFLPLGGDDYEVAKQMVEDYLQLITNQMTALYQTLRQYNKLIHRGEATYDQDIALQLVGVKFPLEGQNFPFSSDNVIDGVINSYYSRGFLTDFRYYVAALDAGVDYDHAAALTGYTYRFEGNEILGLAWVSTICEQSSIERGVSTSTQVLDWTLFSTMAHELGHGFGMSHDGDGNNCPSDTYMMSPSLSIPWEFSRCSAKYLETHTSSIGTENYKQTCLTPLDPGYFEGFCDGFPGTQYSLDEQCQRIYGPNSARCESKQSNEGELSQGYVETCSSGTPFYCYPEVSDGYCYGVDRALWGTKCVIDGVLDPDNICYQETCQSLKICQEEPTTTPAPCACSGRWCCRKKRNADGECCDGCRGRTRGSLQKCSLISE